MSAGPGRYNVLDAHTDQCEDEIERLTLALHKAQRHPDYDYSVTFMGQEEHHTSREGWEQNPALPSLMHPLGRGEQFWMKRKAVSPSPTDTEGGK